jgi:peptide/nickel transport system permease protein
MTVEAVARPASAEVSPTGGALNSHRGSQRMIRRLRRDPIGLAGLLVVLVIVALALAAPIVAPDDPIATNLAESFQPVGSPDHVLGTDLYGRDVFTRAVWGARPSLAVGLIATVIALGIGVSLGIIIGFYGGWFDTLVMRVVDIMLAFPYLLLAIVLVAALGPGLFNAMLAVAITAIPFYIRLIRGMVVTFKEAQFVEASRALGASSVRLMRRAILPSIVPYVIVAFSINIGYLILEGASLSFLGLGAQPPDPEWGASLAENRNYLTLAPHTVVVPGAIIFLVILGLNLFGDALRDALDVRLKDDE